MNDPLAKVKRWFTGGGLLWPVLSLAALLAFNLIYQPAFFRVVVQDGHLYGTLVDVLNQGSKVMLLALGMTLVIGTGGVDLSVGSVMAITGALAALLVTTTALPFAAVLLLCVLAGAALGAWNGLLVSGLRIQPFVATLILMIVGRGSAMNITHGQTIPFEHSAFVFFGNGHFLGLPFTVTIVALGFAATSLLTRRTAIGLFIEAAGDNETASRFCGAPVRLVKVLVYAFSGICAAVAGLIATSNIKAADPSRVGEFLELDAIAAVIIGGTALTGGRFTLVGSIVGALLIQTLTITMYNLGMPPAITPLPKSVVILLAALLQSPIFRAQVAGLFRRRTAA
ncbi:MAG: ABC transporter permease [Chthoniobacter sp.]|nr:ABC transporter permease [Chthoniobacter sp.]